MRSFATNRLRSHDFGPRCFRATPAADVDRLGSCRRPRQRYCSDQPPNIAVNTCSSARSYGAAPTTNNAGHRLLVTAPIRERRMLLSAGNPNCRQQVRTDPRLGLILPPSAAETFASPPPAAAEPARRPLTPAGRWPMLVASQGPLPATRQRSSASDGAGR